MNTAKALPKMLTAIGVDELRAVPAADKIGRGLWIERVLDSMVDGELTAMRVIYEPGGRTNWHSHPRGQLLIVESGVCVVETKAGAQKMVEAGEFVWIPPGELHWHGATDELPMSYVSIQAIEAGRASDWPELPLR